MTGPAGDGVAVPPARLDDAPALAVRPATLDDAPALAVRPATLDDAPALAALIRRAYRGPDSRAGWTSEAELVEGDRIDVDGVRSLIAGPRSRMLVAARDGTPIGCCRIGDHGDGLAHLGTFAVEPVSQGSGIGHRLLEHAEIEAVQAFAGRVVEIEVLDRQAALLAWYERRGYARTGETRPFPGDERHARPLQSGLRFVVLVKPLG